MGKEEILNDIRAARADLRAALDGIGTDDMLRPGVVGVWSIKDILAHLTAWESELVTALNKAQGRGVPHIVLIEDIDEWNEEQYHVNAPRPLDVIWKDFEAVHNMLLTMVRDLPEKLLVDGRRFPWMEGEPLAYLIEENATLHEREHADEIRAWRASHTD